MAARFIRRSDGEALAHAHAVRILFELLRNAERRDVALYPLQFTIDDDKIKGLLVFSMSWNCFEELYEINTENNTESRVIDIQDEQEVFLDGEESVEAFEYGYHDDGGHSSTADENIQVGEAELRRRRSIADMKRRQSKTEERARKESEVRMKGLELEVLNEHGPEKLPEEKTGKAPAKSEKGKLKVKKAKGQDEYNTFNLQQNSDQPTSDAIIESIKIANGLQSWPTSAVEHEQINHAISSQTFEPSRRQATQELESTSNSNVQTASAETNFNEEHTCDDKTEVAGKEFEGFRRDDDGGNKVDEMVVCDTASTHLVLESSNGEFPDDFPTEEDDIDPSRRIINRLSSRLRSQEEESVQDKDGVIFDILKKIKNRTKTIIQRQDYLKKDVTKQVLRPGP